MTSLLVDKNISTNFSFSSKSVLKFDSDNKINLLHLACYNGNIEIVELLLNKGIDVNSKDKIEFTPLFYALMSENIELILFLIDKGANFEKSLLKEVSLLVNIKIIELLLDKGLDVNSKDNEGLTLFQHAILNGKTEVAFTLIKSGANINFTTNFTDEKVSRFYVEGYNKLNIMIMANFNIELMIKFKEINSKNYVYFIQCFSLMESIVKTFIDNNRKDNLSYEDCKLFKNWINIFLTECHDSIVAKKLGIDNIYIARNILQKFNCYLDSVTNFKSNLKKILDRENDNTEDFSTRVTKVLSDVDFHFNR